MQNRNGIIVNYTIFIIVDDSTSMEIMTTAAAAIITDGIRPFTIYTCSVAASTRVGCGPQTAPLSITTPEDGEAVMCFHEKKLLVLIFCSQHFSSTGSTNLFDSNKCDIDISVTVMGTTSDGSTQWNHQTLPDQGV